MKWKISLLLQKQLNKAHLSPAIYLNLSYLCYRQNFCFCVSDIACEFIITFKIQQLYNMHLQKKYSKIPSFDELRSFRDNKNSVKAINRYLSAVENAAAESLTDKRSPIKQIFSQTGKLNRLQEMKEKQAKIEQLTKEVEQQKTIIKLQDELILKLMNKIQKKDTSFTYTHQHDLHQSFTNILDRLGQARQLLEFLQ